MRRRTLIWGSALIVLPLLGCAGTKQRGREASHTAKTKMDPSVAERELALTRAQRYADMYHSYTAAQAKSDALQAKLQEQERESARLRQEVNQARAQGASPSGESGRLVYRGAKGEAVPAGEPGEAAQLRIALEQAETQLKRLRAETSAGPFDSGPRTALKKAYAEIDELKAQLAREREAREQLARQFEQLRAQAPRTTRGERDPMKEQLQHMLETIERDLAISRQNEQELRLALASQGKVPAAAASSEGVDRLRSENAALQARLNEEHQRNQELTAKVEAASRVTGLLFKMKQTQ